MVREGGIVNKKERRLTMSESTKKPIYMSTQPPSTETKKEADCGKGKRHASTLNIQFNLTRPTSFSTHRPVPTQPVYTNKASQSACGLSGKHNKKAFSLGSAPFGLVMSRSSVQWILYSDCKIVATSHGPQHIAIDSLPPAHKCPLLVRWSNRLSGKMSCYPGKEKKILLRWNDKRVECQSGEMMNTY